MRASEQRGGLVLRRSETRGDEKGAGGRKRRRFTTVLERSARGAGGLAQDKQAGQQRLSLRGAGRTTGGREEVVSCQVPQEVV